MELKYTDFFIKTEDLNFVKEIKVLTDKESERINRYVNRMILKRKLLNNR